jgi:hypothetical protein
MDSELVFTLDAVRKIAIFAYETGYCDGIEDKYPQMKDYKNAEDYWRKKEEEYIKRFAKKSS